VGPNRLRRHEDRIRRVCLIWGDNKRRRSSPASTASEIPLCSYDVVVTIKIPRETTASNVMMATPRDGGRAS